MSDTTITKAAAEAMLKLDSRGQPSVSPRERMAIEAERIALLVRLQHENADLRDRVRQLEIERDGLNLKLRGMPHDAAVAKILELRELCRKLVCLAPLPVDVP